ncbi:MAG: arginine--tRNA ligase [Candidatus Paceibacterota bacterium]
MKPEALRLFSQNPEKYLYTIIYTVAQKLIQDTTLNAVSALNFDIETKGIATFGDYSTNIAFICAPLLKKSPLAVAQELLILLREQISSDFFHIEIAGTGFLNFFITPHGWAHIARKLSSPRPRKRFFRKKILIEFSSPNIAKPMSIGHLRATILGNALTHLYRHIGYRPITWNHIGDWGTQFGKLLVAYKKWGNSTIIEKDPINELQKLYVLFHQKAEQDISLEDEARKEFQKLELGDIKNRRVWSYIVKQSLKEFNRMYRLLGVVFNYTIGESFYESRLQPFIQWLQKNKYAHESQGALIIPLEAEGLPPALIQKSDGATLYFTRDMVSLLYRAHKIKPHHMLYVVGGEQILHFKQLQSVNKLLHLTTIPFTHVSFGMITDEFGKKFSTRKGNIVTADTVVEEIIDRSYKIQEEKNPHQSSETKKKTATAIALGVVMHSMLRSDRTSGISFDFDTIFSLSGNSFPYLQYTYARIISILSKVPHKKTGDYTKLTESDHTLTRTLINFEKIIDTCATTQSLHPLAEYLFSLANAVNTVYEKSHIIHDTDIRTRNARIHILTVSAETIAYGLSILGITVQKKL